MKNKKMRTVLTAGALASVLLVGGIAAYFTDFETATNTFTVGQVGIELTEPNWVPPTDITPNQEITKDPTITNNGANDAYVFMEVVVPTYNIKTANADGSVNQAADTELFTYELNTGWVEVGQAVKDMTKNTTTHVYAYATGDTMTALANGAKAPVLFKDEKVKFANVVEDHNLSVSSLDNPVNMVVNGYAIQTSDINGVGADGKKAPADVWAVVDKQITENNSEG